MTLEELSEIIARITSQPVEDMIVERPRDRAHGDWATNVALKLWKTLGYSNPREAATDIAKKLEAEETIEKVEVAGPGFINITLSTATSAAVVTSILEANEKFGLSDVLKGQTLNLEFVSANPTGPIHIGGARWAAVGDSLARIFEANGAKVVREYYFNDHGVQIDKFAESLYAAANGAVPPEDGYAGEYINEIAEQIISENSSKQSSLSVDDFREAGIELMFAQIKQSLLNFGVKFDVFFHEQSLYEDGEVTAAIDKLRELGAIYEQDGATWFKSTEYGDDKDRVVVKSDGNEAYIAGDIAYYLNKRNRGADKAIYMLGADHHGYIGRMLAIAAAFGDTPNVNMQILIGQLVNLVKNGEPVRMSKRAGTVVTLEDFVEAVGTDAARYSLARSPYTSPIDLDLELLASHTNDNPVFYVQYAHARCCSVARKAADAKVIISGMDSIDLSTLTNPTENDLVSTLVQFPGIVQAAAEFEAPHRVARYLEELAGMYHQWYAACRVTPNPDETPEPVHIARLALNNATRIVIASALQILGVSAPERM